MSSLTHCVCVCERERERERKREREREREKVREKERERVCVCLYLCASMLISSNFVNFFKLPCNSPVSFSMIFLSLSISVLA